MVHVFIINPKYTHKDFAATLRETLSRLPDINYYVFTTGAAGDESELARTIEEIFEGEQLRIYCCGGTLCTRNVLNGLRNINDVEIAIYPTLKVQYLEAIADQKAFRDLKRLINGSVKRVDYIKTDQGVALNTVSFGLDPYVYRCYESMYELRVFGKVFPWIAGDLYALLAAPNYQYRIETADGTIVRRAMQMSIYNVPVSTGHIRFSDDWDISDGMSTFVLVDRFSVFGRISYAIKAVGGSIRFSEDDPKNTSRQISRIKIRHSNGIPIWGNMDGALALAPEWNIEVVKQGLKLVVPAGV